MTAPREVRGPSSWLWGVIVALALALALWKAGMLTIEQIRADERAAVLREGDALMAVINRNAGRIARERDSVAQVLAQRDTQLTAALQKAQRVIVREVPFVPTSLVDTSQARAALTTLQQGLITCRDTLAGLVSACEQYRLTSDSARAVGARQRTADSTAMARMAEHQAAITRSRDAAVAALQKRSTWRTVERTTCAVSVAGNLLTFLSR